MAKRLMNVTQFCRTVGIGRTKYYELAEAGLAPRTLRLSERSRALIPASELQEWPERVATARDGIHENPAEAA